jgi:hypothetical protein
MYWSNRARRSALVVALLNATLILSACNEEPGSPAQDVPQKFTIGGTVSGLASGDTVALSNGADPLTVSSNGAFSFASPVTANGSYGVTITTQPTGQVCTISNGSGTAVTTDISNVTVACSTNTYTISGTTSGLASGAQVVLSDNGTDTLTISAGGPFAFATPVAYNGTYLVTVTTQPTGATCTVSNGSGAGVTANISNVNVNCSTDTYTISGSTSGLASGAQVVLNDNGSDGLTVSADGAFTFTTPIAYNGSYAITVATQPSGATCTVSNGGGAGVTANISNVAVTCSTNTYAVGGTVTGLATGTQVTLDNNGADPLTLTANGTFTFATQVVDQGSYNVTVGTQPTGQTCTVINGSGSNLAHLVSNVAVTCSTNTYTIGGSLSGLANGAQVTLDNNGADPLTLTSDGSFTFVTPVAYNGAYMVTIGTQPTGQLCTVTNGSGSAVTANITDVNLTCTASSFSFTTPGSYTWTVPAGVSSIQIVATGGGGGGGGMWGSGAGQTGGAGAIVTSTRNVTAGQVLNLVVGGGGGTGASGPGSGGSYTCGAGGAGGGSSNVDSGTSDQIIAGGGGGGGSCNSATAGGNGGGAGGAGGDGGALNQYTTGGSGGNGGIGGAGAMAMFGNGVAGGNGVGGAGGEGGNNGGSYPGGTGGSSVGAGIGGVDGNNDSAGGGGGGYGGGGSGADPGTGGGAGGSTGPAGSTYAPSTNGGASATNGGNGSIVITLQ